MSPVGLSLRVHRNLECSPQVLVVGSSPGRCPVTAPGVVLRPRIYPWGRPRRAPFFIPLLPRIYPWRWGLPHDAVPRQPQESYPVPGFTSGVVPNGVFPKALPCIDPRSCTYGFPIVATLPIAVASLTAMAKVIAMATMIAAATVIVVASLTAMATVIVIVGYCCRRFQCPILSLLPLLLLLQPLPLPLLLSPAYCQLPLLLCCCLPPLLRHMMRWPTMPQHQQRR